MGSIVGIWSNAVLRHKSRAENANAFSSHYLCLRTASITVIFDVCQPENSMVFR
jgi:hypothetical protein